MTMTDEKPTYDIKISNLNLTSEDVQSIRDAMKYAIDAEFGHIRWRTTGNSEATAPAESADVAGYPEETSDEACTTQSDYAIGYDRGYAEGWDAAYDRVIVDFVRVVKDRDRRTSL